MKKHLFAATLLLLTFTSVVSAQSLRGSYFFETSLQRGKLNAAFAPQNNYVSVPLIGSISSDAVSNVGLANFIFPSGNAPYTFMHENVPAGTFLSGLPEADPFLKARAEIDLLGGGFRVGERGYVTVALSAAAETEAIVPNEFLRFAKTGENGIFPGPRINAFSYGILSAGFSYDWDNWCRDSASAAGSSCSAASSPANWISARSISSCSLTMFPSARTAVAIWQD